MSDSEIINTSSQVDKILIDIFERYTQSDKSIPIEIFIRDTLVSSSFYPTADAAQEVAEKISKTIAAIRHGYEAIQEYKSRGLSNSVWLRDSIDAATSTMQQKEKDIIVSSLKQALSKSNVHFFSTLTDNEEQIPLVPELDRIDFNGIEKTGIAQNIKEEIEINTLFGAVTSDGICMPPPREPGLDIVKDYFEAKLDEEKDDDFKKLVATGIEIAKEHDLLPESLAERSTDELAVVVDRGVATAKLAYKVAQGEFEVADATDYLIDRAVSSVGTVVKTQCEVYGAAAGGTIGGAIGSLFGPQGTAVGTVIGQKVGAFAGKFVGEYVVKGVKKIAQGAKVLAEKASDAVKKAASWVSDKVSGALDWLTGWF